MKTKPLLKNLIAAGLVGALLEFILFGIMLWGASPAGSTPEAHAMMSFHSIGFWLDTELFGRGRGESLTLLFAVGWVQCVVISWVIITTFRSIAHKTT